MSRRLRFGDGTVQQYFIIQYIIMNRFTSNYILDPYNVTQLFYNVQPNLSTYYYCLLLQS